MCFSGVAPFAYHNAPDKTAARSLCHGRQSFGDLGHVDHDGYLYLTDRQDDMIISGGVNIYPQEIEAAIRGAAGVWDCAVVGVPDARFDERPVAFVVPLRAPARADLVGEVRRHCEAHLARYKQPQAIYPVTELPPSPTGKLLRRELRKRIAQNLEEPG